jgi:hypothetical protein
MYALRTIYSYYFQKVKTDNDDNNVIKKNNVNDEKKPLIVQSNTKYKDYTIFDQELSTRIERLMKNKSD